MMKFSFFKRRKDLEKNSFAKEITIPPVQTFMDISDPKLCRTFDKTTSTQYLTRVF
jgi:hypothetical protein